MPKKYKFSELDEAAKQRVREWYVQDVDRFEWWDYVFETAKADGEKRGFDIEDIRFSGFWSQGDGASWKGTVDFARFVKHRTDKYLHDARFALVMEMAEQHGFYPWRIDYSSHQYCHSGTMSDAMGDPCIQYNVDSEGAGVVGEGMLAGARWSALYSALEVDDWLESVFRKEVLNEARAYADEIYRRLAAEYDYQTSDACIEEMCEANGWRFSEDGAFE